MNGTIIVAIITVVGSIVAAAITSYLTKAKDREAEWRAVKLTHYKQFMTALSAIVGPKPTDEERITFADAANDISLVGSPAVLVVYAVILTKLRIRTAAKSWIGTMSY